MRFNHAILVLVLAISALLARGYFRAETPLSFSADLKLSLDRYWGNSASEVEVTGAGDVRIRVSIPPATRLLQKEWTFPLSRFVAARHPGVRLHSLTVTDSTTEKPLVDASTLRQCGTFLDQAYFEAANGEILRRNAQSKVDALAGPGRILVLIDVSSRRDRAVSWLPNLPSSYAGSSETYGYGGGFHRGERRRVGYVPIPRYQLVVARIEACLVFNSVPEAALAHQAVEAIKLSTRLHEGRLRQFVLP